MLMIIKCQLHEGYGASIEGYSNFIKVFSVQCDLFKLLLFIVNSRGLSFCGALILKDSTFIDVAFFSILLCWMGLVWDNQQFNVSYISIIVWHQLTDKIQIFKIMSEQCNLFQFLLFVFSMFSHDFNKQVWCYAFVPIWYDHIFFHFDLKLNYALSYD